MKYYTTLFYVTVINMIIMMCVVILATVTHPPYTSSVPNFTKYSDMIGMPMWGQSWCDYSNVSDGLMFCVIDASDGDVLITYDIRANKVIVASKFMTDPVAIGDLILTWGTPTGTSVENGRRLVYWGTTRAAFILGDFTPSSRVSFVTFWSDAGTREIKPWAGFTNRSH